LNNAAFESRGEWSERSRLGDHTGRIYHCRRIQSCDVRVIENIVRFGDKFGPYAFPERKKSSGIAHVELIDIGTTRRVARQISKFSPPSSLAFCE